MLYGAIDIHRLIGHCVDALEPLRRQRSAICDLQLNGQNPKVLGVESQIEQVLINLLTNAYQALNGPGGQVTIRTRNQGERVRVEIEDNGVGIAPDLLDKIFEPFYTTRRDGNALGLGLHTAKWIVEEHGGELSVRSTPGVATIFALELLVTPAGGART
jgi:signal transduction histidine kinase